MSLWALPSAGENALQEDRGRLVAATLGVGDLGLGRDKPSLDRGLEHLVLELKILFVEIRLAAFELSEEMGRIASVLASITAPEKSAASAPAGGSSSPNSSRSSCRSRVSVRTSTPKRLHGPASTAVQVVGPMFVQAPFWPSPVRSYQVPLPPVELQRSAREKP